MHKAGNNVVQTPSKVLLSESVTLEGHKGKVWKFLSMKYNFQDGNIDFMKWLCCAMSFFWNNLIFLKSMSLVINFTFLSRQRCNYDRSFLGPQTLRVASINWTLSHCHSVRPSIHSCVWFKRFKDLPNFCMIVEDNRGIIFWKN